MVYFSRRNKIHIEYSGHEDVSNNLRHRLVSIVDNNTVLYPVVSYSASKPGKLKYERLVYAVQKEFPNSDPKELINLSDYDSVFTVVEIFWDELSNIDSRNSAKAKLEMAAAFKLSGSVYGINLRTGRIELVVDEDFAKKIKETEEILAPFKNAQKIFLEASGNLFGKKAKPKDIVRDMYVAAEEYLKKITGESQFSSSIKKLRNNGVIIDEQKAVLEKLYAYRSNTQGTTHAGDNNEPSEVEAIWFIDTMSAQVRYIDIKNNGKK